MNYSNNAKPINVLYFGLILLFAPILLNAQTAEFRIGEPLFDIFENQHHFPIQVRSDLAGNLEVNLRLISSTTDFDYENSRLSDLNGGTLSNMISAHSNNNNGSDFGFPCEFFFKSGNASITIADSDVNTFVDIAVFEAGILGNIPVQFCPSIILEKSSIEVGYMAGSSGIEATISNMGTYQLMDEVVNHLNWEELNPTNAPFGQVIYACLDHECETQNPNCTGVDVQFRIGEPFFDIVQNQLEYPIQINSSLAGFVESNVRLFTSTGFYDADNTQLSDLSFNILGGHVLDVSTGNAGEAFGLPCELIKITGNAQVDVLQANTWQTIAILEAGINGNFPLPFCPSIIFDKTAECVGFIPPSAGTQAIISTSGNLSQPMNETVHHLNWVETDPVNSPFGYQYEVCGEDPCADDCEDLITMEHRVGNKRSRLMISYNGALIPNNRLETECCIEWNAPGVTLNPCPGTVPFGLNNHNPMNMFNGTAYTATVICGDCTVVFSGVAGDPSDTEGRIGYSDSDEIEIYPNLVKSEFVASNLMNAKSLYILNANGAEVFNSDIPLGSYSFNMNIENFERGIYILVVKNADGSIQTEKLIKQ